MSTPLVAMLISVAVVIVFGVLMTVMTIRDDARFWRLAKELDRQNRQAREEADKEWLAANLGDVPMRHAE